MHARLENTQHNFFSLYHRLFPCIYWGLTNVCYSQKCDAGHEIKNDRPLRIHHQNYPHISRVSCQKGPICHAYAWRVGPFWQDNIEFCRFRYAMKAYIWWECARHWCWHFNFVTQISVDISCNHILLPYDTSFLCKNMKPMIRICLVPICRIGSNTIVYISGIWLPWCNHFNSYTCPIPGCP